MTFQRSAPVKERMVFMITADPLISIRESHEVLRDRVNMPVLDRVWILLSNQIAEEIQRGVNP